MENRSKSFHVESFYRVIRENFDFKQFSSKCLKFKDKNLILEKLKIMEKSFSIHPAIKSGLLTFKKITIRLLNASIESFWLCVFRDTEKKKKITFLRTSCFDRFFLCSFYLFTE
jgi:hypothetical protein